MRNIIILQGIPASGKSTWAREFVKEHNKYVIVNRDSLRNGAGEYWVPEREKYITRLENSAVTSALEEGYNVIIDATNFNWDTLRKWDNIAKEYNAKVDIKRFDISLREAIDRDAKRDQPVGEKVIKRFYNQYCNFKDNRKMEKRSDEKEDIIICDIDGTVALRTNRSPFDSKKYLTDVPEWRVVKLIESLSQNYKIVFLSGREGTEQAYNDTLNWIRNNINLNYDTNPVFELLMREQGDKRPDEEVKNEIYRTQLEPIYNVISVFDDRDKVVKMWRDLGILCCQVYYGDF